MQFPSTGRSSPLGASIVDGGTNFSLYSRGATAVELLLFDHEDDAQPARTIRIDPATNRTYHYWHVFVHGVKAGQLYGYRVDGPCVPEVGLRFDREKLLLDPYARAVVLPKHYDREAARHKGNNTSTAMKSVVVDPCQYDWEGDLPICRPFVAHDHLRDARPRLHAASQLRRRRKDPRHLRRPDREDPLPARSSASRPSS